MSKGNVKQDEVSSPHPSGRAVGPRSLLQGPVALAGSSMLPALASAGDTKPAVVPPPPGTANTIILASDSNAIVETTAGKVRGFTRNGIYTFFGIPYAGTTEGKAR